MLAKFHHLFFLKKPKSSRNGATIYLRITMAGKRVEISMGNRIECNDKWAPRVGRIIGDSRKAKKLNTHLNFLEHQLYETYLMVLLNEEITAISLKRRLVGIDDHLRILVPIFQKHNSRIAALVPKQYAAGTLERFKTCLSHTIEFMRWKYNISDIAIQSIDNEFICDYDFYLRSVRKCSNNTTVKYLKNFKKIIRMCLSNGWIDKDPFLMYKASINEVEAVYLLEEELEAIRKKNFSTNRHKPG